MKPLDAAKRILDLTREGWAIDRLSIDWALQHTGDLRCSHINTVAECREHINHDGEQHGQFQKQETTKAAKVLR